MNPLVAIVILNWNNAPDTIACLASVARLCYPRFKTLVVDNASADGSADAIQNAFPNVEILRLDQNYGYAEGNNRGIRRVLGDGASGGPEYVLVLNNDTAVAPDMLDILASFAEAHPRAAMVGPKVLCAAHLDAAALKTQDAQIFDLGSAIDWKRGHIHHTGMFENAALFERETEPRQTDFLAGCGVLARSSFIKQSGALDPLYFLNFEDVEWGVRAARAGWENWLVPRAVMWHKVSATLGLGSPSNTYYMTRNALRFFWGNALGLARWSAVGRVAARAARSSLAWALKPAYRADKNYARRRRANLLAMRDFALGRFGPMGKDVKQAFDRA